MNYYKFGDVTSRILLQLFKDFLKSLGRISRNVAQQFFSFVFFQLFNVTSPLSKSIYIFVKYNVLQQHYQ